MACIMNGNASPFSTEHSAYEYYQVDCWMQRIKPVSEKKYKDWIAWLAAHTEENKKIIIMEAKQYKCYVL